MGDPGCKKHLRQKPASVNDSRHQTNDERIIGEGGGKDRHDGVDIPKTVGHKEETDVQRVDDGVMAKILRHGCRDFVLRADAENIRNKVANAIGHRCCG